MTCVGCGSVHGSVTLELLCLRSHLKSARALVDAVRRPKIEADALGCSKGGSVEEMRNMGKKKPRRDVGAP